ncbi:hypothetical protein SAY87_008553 [Trapa incisa]|uniref:RING-type domain-containing protein n=1 Tax=Trapa incisa TaxID=236973 RepID=A0AAN7JVH2_9MYRT|nr:hypothetical protein SAY87_008553 [Trapa incisa]
MVCSVTVSLMPCLLTSVIGLMGCILPVLVIHDEYGQTLLGSSASAHAYSINKAGSFWDEWSLRSWHQDPIVCYCGGLSPWSVEWLSRHSVMALEAMFFQDNLLGFPICRNPQELFMDEEGICDCLGGCGTNFNSHQFSQRQVLMMQLQKNHTFRWEPGYTDGVANKRLVPIAAHPHPHPQTHHAHEIDQYLYFQNESLKLTLREQRKMEMAGLLGRIESKSQMLMNQKDQEMAQAARKTTELQELLARLEAENVTWRWLAEENHAMVVSLNNDLEELRKDGACNPSETHLKVGNSTIGRPLDDQERTDENTVAAAEAVLAACRGCGSQAATVLFLPCRHLCVCGPCTAFLDSCPVCNVSKKACIEALFQ